MTERRNRVAKETEEVKDNTVEEKGKSQKVAVMEVTELVEGSDLFLSHGFSNVKVTKGEKVTNVKLPIKSSGVTELIEEFKEREPTPPSEEVMVKKDSDLGRQLKVTENRPVRMANLNDPKYVKAYNKYESELGIAILQKGLDVVIKDKEGKEITDNTKKIAILKGMGMSGPQFTQVVQDIRVMTEWDEQERLDFFGES